MATNVNYEGSTYTVAAVGERTYAGSNRIDGLLIALAQNVLQKQGGNFTLAADVDWGDVAGHVVKYLKSKASNPASAGVLRLAVGDLIAFRNNANSGDLSVGVNASDRLTFGGVALPTISSTDTLTNKTIDAASNTLSNIANASIAAAAAIAYSKLNLASSIVNADIANAAAIAYSKLNLASSIVNADIANAAAIAYSKLNLTGAILNADISASAGITVSKLSSGAASANQVATADGAGNVNWSAPIGDSSAAVLNSSLAASVASNALTIALKDKGGSDPSASSKVQIGFRSATAATGTYNSRTVSAALSITVPSGTTIGTANNTQAYIYVYAIDNAGTVELAVSLFRFDEGSVQNTTAISGGSSSTTLYSTTARTGVPIRLIGRLSVTETTAGTWASAPTEISNIPFIIFPAPTVQKFTSGSGTYTTPAGVKYIRVRMVGGGGGGAGSGVGGNGGTGGNGGNSTFGTSLLVANGGTGASGGITSTPTGGSASLGTGPIGVALQGGPGGGAQYQNITTVDLAGGNGAATPFGGGGVGVYNAAGTSPVANTGAGGGGGGNGPNANSYSGSGGAAGGFIDAIITSPSATYAFAIGAAGTAGSAGTSGFAGAAGAAGFIIVEEFYQ